MEHENERSFGVFKPVGHVVISFPHAEQAVATERALLPLGLKPAAEGGLAVRLLTDQQMRAHIDRDLEHPSPLAAIGQELNLIRAQRELAGRGYHFLVVHAPDDQQASQAAEVARQHGAERAQHYGRFIIEDLIDRPGHLPQVGESPDRGLDAQTPSGLEVDAGELRRQEEQVTHPRPID